MNVPMSPFAIDHTLAFVDHIMHRLLLLLAVILADDGSACEMVRNSSNFDK